MRTTHRSLIESATLMALLLPAVAFGQSSLFDNGQLQGSSATGQLQQMTGRQIQAGQLSGMRGVSAGNIGNINGMVSGLGMSIFSMLMNQALSDTTVNAAQIAQIQDNAAQQIAHAQAAALARQNWEASDLEISEQLNNVFLVTPNGPVSLIGTQFFSPPTNPDLAAIADAFNINIDSDPYGLDSSVGDFTDIPQPAPSTALFQVGVVRAPATQSFWRSQLSWNPDASNPSQSLGNTESLRHQAGAWLVDEMMDLGVDRIPGYATLKEVTGQLGNAKDLFQLLSTEYVEKTLNPEFTFIRQEANYLASPQVDDHGFLENYWNWFCRRDYQMQQKFASTALNKAGNETIKNLLPPVDGP